MRLAQKNRAYYYNPNQKDSITLNGDGYLEINLLFRTEDSACDFQNDLIDFSESAMLSLELDERIYKKYITSELPRIFFKQDDLMFDSMGVLSGQMQVLSQWQVPYDSTNAIYHWQSIENFNYIPPKLFIFKCPLAVTSKSLRFQSSMRDNMILYGTQL